VIAPDFVARLHDVQIFYDLLARLEVLLGGKRTLATAHGRMAWPERGVYFFFEPGEPRSTSGSGLRVVRVGTHALNRRGRTTLWGRLRMHRGTIGGPRPGGGNHRKSVFRRHVGDALLARDDWPAAVAENWRSDPSASTRAREYPLERAVSRHIRNMPFLWIAVEDSPGRESLRGYVERNAIALLSNYSPQGTPIDPRSSDWLGRYAAGEEVRRSGLWNSQHVKGSYHRDFLDALEQHIDLRHAPSPFPVNAGGYQNLPPPWNGGD